MRIQVEYLKNSILFQFITEFILLYSTFSSFLSRDDDSPDLQRGLDRHLTYKTLNTEQNQ